MGKSKDTHTSYQSQLFLAGKQFRKYRKDLLQSTGSCHSSKYAYLLSGALGYRPCRARSGNKARECALQSRTFCGRLAANLFQSIANFPPTSHPTRAAMHYVYIFTARMLVYLQQKVARVKACTQ